MTPVFYDNAPGYKQIDRGWIVLCATPDCTGAERPRIGASTMTCVACDATWPITWPVDRADIERVLADRPVPATRAWLPTETVADLAAENAAHGIAGY